MKFTDVIGLIRGKFWSHMCVGKAIGIQREEAPMLKNFGEKRPMGVGCCRSRNIRLDLSISGAKIWSQICGGEAPAMKREEARSNFWDVNCRK